METANNIHIEFKNITKIFPGTRALDDVSFTVKRGEIHALVGENGAGKSTLLNILHGMYQATSGHVLINGETVDFKTPQDAIKFGIAKVHQEINVVPEMTVYQNIMLGSEPTNFGIFMKRAEMIRIAQELLDRLNCNFRATDRMVNLSVGQKQMVQIAKTLHTETTIVSFDEPSSSLSDSEVKSLFEIIETMRERGRTIIYISHKMDEIFDICDRATVLRDGKYINTFDLKTCSSNDLVRAMVGRDISMYAQRLHPSCRDDSTNVLEVMNLTSRGKFSNINFDLKKGEILGFFGLVGAMRTEVMRGIFGIDPITSGTILINGKNYKPKNPKHAVKNGLGLVPENRKEEGFVSNLVNRDNMTLSNLGDYTVAGLVNVGRQAEAAVAVGETVNLQPNRPAMMTKSLSGGNAQKVVIGKWLASDADIYIFDEPTKGVDIGAKSQIYSIMEDLVAKGRSIILVSSEMVEAFGMCDRLIVMRNGRITAEFERDEFDQELVLTKAFEDVEDETEVVLAQ
jgi:ribose transport system ATP-binding protein